MEPQKQLELEKKLDLEPIPAKQAIEEIETYRSMMVNNGYGFWYYAADIKRYIEKDFTQFVQTHPNSGNEFVWVVGFYFKIHKGNLSVCLIPTEYDTLNGKITDRISKDSYESVRPTYMFDGHAMPMSINPTDPPGDGEVFDKGDMWP